MKRLLSLLTGVLVMTGLLMALIFPQSAYANVSDEKLGDRGEKVDLNNSSVRAFRQFPGMFPTIAGKIVVGGPYSSVSDASSVLDASQKSVFDKYKDNFTVTDQEIAVNEGFDRINDGQYR
ncbi:MAG: photosystem II complex extrinsic protein PsbU [Prochlorococcus sp. MED-G132]|mgnify:FL=1|uniref:Photosystem II extrinsic protein U n=1 Tax=Prochlorococcus marinus (strain MIT 9303) TaxID=59922 RepID=PSBU_PROM3|nr:photosystem II complex extrinsic protein PsbU [Prochlorococcus marinus]A2C664.1 RecName: Full=Photosystem II extrinsic protein U; Short=PSII-U; Short=PsbU; AltName: Full=Photosystem II 12 kDa extrinsic protein; Short=PS II complex 12 kDa extrinsic protein; Flags: Precursor [Prochlorococcus marinus str. MIT 9303]ABM76974.1 putative Photosystem II PsbU protein [Prochlorococcus marinus str. MIT 9303]RZO50670.1 MAG: photosystem II complex extrinsic protein PsbU [Prochlorococcus sp. MED-G132]CAI8